MFDCGPPEDFRCKFTSQIQYMSGILRRKEIQTSSNVQSDNNPPHSSNAGSNGRGNNQHETELNQLRYAQAYQPLHNYLGDVQMH